MSEPSNSTVAPATSSSAFRKPYEFSIGAVLKKSLAIFAGNFLAYYFVALLLLAPSFIFEVYYSQAVAQGQANSELQTGIVIMAIVNMLTALFLTGVLTYGTFMQFRGQPVTLGATFSRALERIAAMLFVAIAFGIMAGLASILLIIPGIYVCAIFFVVMPVTIIEDTGAGETFGRSAALTKGSRWKLSGSVLVVILLSALWQVLSGVFFETLVLDVGGLFWSAKAISFLLYVVATAYAAVFIAATYHDLRRAKGELEPQ